MSKLTEDTLAEQPVIEWLKELGYDYEYGPDISVGGKFEERDSFDQVVLVKRLMRILEKLNPNLGAEQLEDAASQIVKLEFPNIDTANQMMYQLLVEGVKVEIRGDDGQTRGEIVKVFDFEDPENNEFLVVNQFTIQGIENIRRPDVVVFVNGIPLVVFELKSPTSADGTIKSAYKQLMKTYKQDIPDIFKYNQILVVSDLVEARHGTLTAPWEWFKTWKGIESENEESKSISELEVLIKGLMDKKRLMDVIQNFTVFESDSDKVIKKMCMYHQYYGVNKAVKETLRATASDGDRKIGVFWHTQGSGKTLSMVFYTNKTRRLRELKNPTFVYLTDRNDLDGQFYRTFLQGGYPFAKQAESIDDLKESLRVPAGGMVFTTIQKFQDLQGEFPILSERENIIVISDEAHRSQYARLAGNVRTALPKASFMGITGTPISLNNRDTQMTFGEYITSYKINQAVEDGATVPIYYEGRLVPLHLSNQFIDEEFESMAGDQEYKLKQDLKSKWARLEQAVGAKGRLDQVANDIVEHYNGRGLEGKGMIVTMSREIAVRMYETISKMKNAPEVAVVISKVEDFKGRVQKELKLREIENKFKDPDDPLKLVIVCDMWLTGFDVPSMHTMYIDKPLRDHNLMQAIARVNRIFKDKKGGLIVDYIGIADNLKKSLGVYGSDVQKEAMIPLEEAVAKMMEKYDVVTTYFAGVDFSGWKKLKGANLAQLFHQAVNVVISDEKSGVLDEERQKRYLTESTHLFKLFALISPHAEANKIRNDVEFFQAIKKNIIKRTVSQIKDIDEDLDSAVRELVSAAIGAEGVIDIFQMQGKEKLELSIFDDKFIEEVQKTEYKNVAIAVMRKLLNDEIRLRMHKNVVRYNSLLELLEQVIEDYENRIIDSTKVIQRLVELAREIKVAEAAGADLGLSEEEVAFYDAIAMNGDKVIKEDDKLKRIVQDLVKAIRRDLTVDWTNNEMIKAKIRADVNRILLVSGIQLSEPERQRVLERIFRQAIALFKDFSPVRV